MESMDRGCNAVVAKTLNKNIQCAAKLKLETAFEPTFEYAHEYRWASGRKHKGPILFVELQFQVAASLGEGT